MEALGAMMEADVEAACGLRHGRVEEREGLDARPDRASRRQGRGRASAGPDRRWAGDGTAELG
ncbi:msr6073 [Mesorhizobium japonicum MAFF 303099]|uniref:Msr6073 protein n=1 Tax=Mesorhizobium japonicum (strain LMG 29417 / CECT 9101 / MAFF 303099) TaxID=266835 RepID=Q98AB7_RHILO|nr:msr6073 [Mesorhizobium japonicum MAFF 303099]